MQGLARSRGASRGRARGRGALGWLCALVLLVGGCIGSKGPAAGEDGAPIEVAVYRGEAETASRTISVELAGPAGGWELSAADGSSAPRGLFARFVAQRGDVADFELTIFAHEFALGAHPLTLQVGILGRDLSSSALTVPITLHVMEPFRVAEAELELDTTLDGGDDPSRTLGLLGAQSRWKIEDAPAWLELEKTEGVGNASLGARCRQAALAGPGLVSASLKITDLLGGRVISLPVRCFAEPHRLLLAEHGLAFSRFANAERLVANVVIEQNGRRPLSWAAEAMASWLSVSASGQTGRAMRVTADPAGLTPGMHYGEIWISNPVSAAPVEKIRVGLYLSAAELPATVSHPVLWASDVRDPIRPRIYLLTEQQLLARNIYTGQIEETYPLPAGTSLLRLCDVSDDGSSVFLEDLSGWDPSNPFGHPPRDIYRVNLDRPAQPAQLLFTERATMNGDSNGPLPIRFFRNNGVPALFNAIGRLHHAETGAVLGEFQWNWRGTSESWVPVFRPTRVSIARGGAHFALANESLQTGNGISLYEMRLRAVPGAKARIRSIARVPYQYPSSLEPGMMLLNRELDRIYVRFGYLEKVGAGWEYRPRFNTEHTFTEAADGALFGAGLDAAGARVLGEFSKDGAPLRTFAPATSLGWQLPWVSSDGLAVFATHYDAGGEGVLHGYRR